MERKISIMYLRFETLDVRRSISPKKRIGSILQGVDNVIYSSCISFTVIQYTFNLHSSKFVTDSGHGVPPRTKFEVGGVT